MLPGFAKAQSSPGLVFGQVPSPGQWNGYLSKKLDVYTGGLPITLGGTGANTRLGAQVALNVPGLTTDNLFTGFNNLSNGLNVSAGVMQKAGVDVVLTNDSRLNIFTGDSGSGGILGITPAPPAGSFAAGKYLSAGGGWTVPAGAGAVTPSGGITPGHCTQWASSTSISDAGSACGAGAGGITALTGDGTATGPGSASLTITKTGGVSFSASATVDATNAANVGSGVLPTGRLSGAYAGITGLGTILSGIWNGSVVGQAYGGAGTVSGALRANGSGVVTQAACSDLSNGNTGCSAAVGTTGGTLAAGNDSRFTAFTGDSGSGGILGTVPAPAAGDAAAGKFLSAGGGWSVPPVGAKAWVTFVGSTGAILDSYNVTSVTRNTTSNYTIAFTSSFSNAYYAWSASGGNSGQQMLSLNDWAGGWYAKSTSSFSFVFGSSTTGGIADADQVSVIFQGR